jgi:hypothetical protein
MMGMPKKRGADLPPEALEFFRQQGKDHGAEGGRKAAENMTPEERSKRAKKAVQARWKKKKKKA